MALIQKAFSDIVTFSRSSNATRIGPTGLVEYAPHNLFLRSQEFDNASWTLGAATVTANAVAAPDGTITADKLIADGTSSVVHNIRQGVTSTGIPVTFSFYAKQGEYPKCGIREGAATGGYATFNLSTGVVIEQLVGTATIASVGNGWYRCTFTITATNPRADIYPLPSGYTSGSPFSYTYTGDSSSGIYLWGAQASQGPLPLDYTPTTSAAVYGPRFDFDPVTLAAKGLLIEEQRTNLLTYSQDFSNVAWLKDRLSIGSLVLAPNNTTTAATLIEDTTAANDHYLRSPLSIYSASTISFSVFVKKKDTRHIGLRLLTGSNDYATAVFSLDTGLETKKQSAGGYSSVSTTSQALGNGWYRLSMTATTTGSGAVSVLVSNSTTPTIGSFGEIAYTGDGTSGLYIWGAQLEAGSFATSYIPTVASTVTRSADVASVNTLSPWYNATAGTLYAELNRYAASVGVRGAFLNDGTTGNYIAATGTVAANLTGIVVASFSTEAQLGAGGSAIGVQKIAFAFAANDFALSENGAAVLTDTSGSLPTVSALGIGSLTTNVGSGHIRRIAYYPRRLTNAELQALSA